LLVLLAAGGLGIAGITAGNGGTRSSPFRLDVPGYQLPGQGSRLFFFDLLVVAAAMLGLSTMVAGLGRGFRRHPASRQLLTGSRQQTSARQAVLPRVTSLSSSPSSRSSPPKG
jgi:hypothetical protein